MVYFLLLCFAVTFSASNKKSLDDLRWEKRVLIVFDPIAVDQDFWEENTKSFEDRRLAVFHVTSSDEVRSNYPREISLQSIKKKRNNPEQVWILIGLDGGTKASGEASTFEIESIFKRIDSMPMRQSEIRKKDG